MYLNKTQRRIARVVLVAIVIMGLFFKKQIGIVLFWSLFLACCGILAYLQKMAEGENGQTVTRPVVEKVTLSKEELAKKKQRRFAYIFFGILGFGILLGLVEDSGPTDISGAYYSEGETYNNHIDIYQSGDVLLHYDSHMGHGNRWGRYSFNEETKELSLAFNDGGPQFEQPLSLERHDGKMCIDNGGTLFIKSDSHPDNFIEPEAKRSYSR